MKFELSYNLASLHAAAAFIWENNPYVTKWPSAPRSASEVMSLIHEDMVRHASKNAASVLEERNTKVSTLDKWISHTGTGGYYLMFELQSEDDDSIVIAVDVLVDPGVGSPVPRYKSEVIDELVTTV